MGASGTPHEAGLVEVGVDIAERGGAELVRVAGELSLEEIVSGWLSGTPHLELFGHRTDPGSEGGQRVPGTGVDVGGQHSTELGHHLRAGIGDDRRDLVGDHLGATGSRGADQGSAHPTLQCRVDAIGEVGREVGQAGLVVGQARFGLRVHPLRLR